MKKHLLGLTIFSFIFASFAFAFALIYKVKNPQFQQNEVIQHPVFEIESRNSCNKKSKKLSFEIISTQYDFDQKKLITKVRMKLDQRGTPKSLSIGTTVYFDGQTRKITINETQRALLKTFEVIDNEAVFYFVTEFDRKHNITRNENLYAVFDIIPKFSDGEKLENSGRLYRTNATSVLFVHGKNSVIE